MLVIASCLDLFTIAIILAAVFTCKDFLTLIFCVNILGFSGKILRFLEIFFESFRTFLEIIRIEF